MSDSTVSSIMELTRKKFQSKKGLEVLRKTLQFNGFVKLKTNQDCQILSFLRKRIFILAP